MHYIYTTFCENIQKTSFYIDFFINLGYNYFINMDIIYCLLFRRDFL